MNRKTTAALLSASVLLASARAALCADKPKSNGFLGHYGYLVSYPTDYAAQADFDGPVEVVQFVPNACRALNKDGCVRAGLFSLIVIPKKSLFDENKISSVAQYVQGLYRLSQRDGEKPGAMRTSAVGAFKEWTFSRETPKRGPFNTTTYVDGAKVCYVFAYQRENARMASIVKGLTEIQPTDVPPAP